MRNFLNFGATARHLLSFLGLALDPIGIFIAFVMVLAPTLIPVMIVWHASESLGQIGQLAAVALWLLTGQRVIWLMIYEGITKE